MQVSKKGYQCYCPPIKFVNKKIAACENNLSAMVTFISQGNKQLSN